MKTLWFGYLNAGDKSSAIIKDSSLNTGNAATLYLYNHSQESIREYQRAIVEPKLRELKDGEANATEMEKAYKKIKAEFVPRGGRLSKLATQAAAPPPKPEPEEDEPELDEEDFDDDLDMDDD
jgi:hypothetical protein